MTQRENRCHFCGKPFITNAALDAHDRAEHLEPEEPSTVSPYGLYDQIGYMPGSAIEG